MRIIITDIKETIGFEHIQPTDTVGLIINGTKYISVRDNKEPGDCVKKMCYDLVVEDFTYTHIKSLLNSFKTCDKYYFETTKEALEWLIK